MGQLKEYLEPLTVENAVQCDMCNHIFYKDKTRSLDLSEFGGKYNSTVYLCFTCRRKWLNLVNLDIKLQQKEAIFADNLDKIMSSNLE